MARKRQNTLHLAAVQMKVRVGGVDWNLKRSLELIEQAASRKTDLVCFPECVLDGYACGRKDFSHFARPHDGPEVQAVAAAAKKHGVAVLWSLAEKVKEGICNTALLLDRAGRLRLHYRKVHLCIESGESDTFVQGKEFPVVRLAGIPVGIGAMICFDRHFPEAARTMRLAGAGLILHPTATIWFRPEDRPKSSPARRATLQSVNTAMMRTRAYENRCFVLSVNQVNYGGGSALYGPRGDVLAQAGREEETLRCTIDLGQLRRPGPGRFDILKTRRPQTYSRD